MPDKPTISVLMGVYNCATTVGASMQSILDQEFTDFEFIICDDGSVDGTLAVVRRYAEQDSRIVVLENEGNRGLSYTLNRCLGIARGRYLARMDGDDLSMPGRFSAQLHFLESHPDIALCGSSIEFFDDEGTWGSLLYPEYPVAGSFLLRSPFAHPTVMIRAEVMKELGGYDTDPSIGRSEDYDFFMRLYAAGFRGYNFQDILFRYREERASYHKRKFRFAVVEARVRWRGFSLLGLLPGGLPYVLKPLMIGLLPVGLYRRIRKAVFKIRF